MIDDLYMPSKGGRTPIIDFKINGILEIKGKSYPDDSLKHYEPTMNWLKQYSKNPNAITIFNVDLEYVNTGSCIIMSEILKILKDLHVSNKTDLTINWNYDEDDEGMYNIGLLYKDIFKIPFNLIQII
jgi:hypothetical protein